MIVPHVATHGLFVDGRWIEEGDIVEIKAPFDGAVIGRVHQGKRKHAEAAIAAAVKAFGTTRRLPAFERQRVLRQISQGIASRKESFRARSRGKLAPIKAARTKSTARSSLSRLRPKRVCASTVNIYHSTGRNTQLDVGVSFDDTRWAHRGFSVQFP
jgi:hypothetical protein